MIHQTVTRFHDFSYGHRVHGHESKCAFFHGHNGRVHFTVRGNLDSLGRVLDFGVVNQLLCHWVEEYWDHKFLAWGEDPIIRCIERIVTQEVIGNSNHYREALNVSQSLASSVVWVPFNPTAENMANYLLTVVGPQQLKGTGVELVRVTVEETRKCSATVDKEITKHE